MPAHLYDPEAPSSARLWNLWLGGRNVNAADRAKAKEIEEACPQIPEMARHARLFSANVTAWAASEGIGQFLELGCGLPHGSQVHEVARSVRETSRVCYVDRDYGVTDEFPALLGFPAGEVVHDGLAVLNGDLAAPCKVVAEAAFAGIIDVSLPACVLLVGVLHLMGDEEAREVIAGYASLLPEGSLVAVTLPSIPGEVDRQRMARAHLASARYQVTPGEFAGLFGRMRLVPPGVGPAASWRPGWGCAKAVPAGTPHVLAAAARVGPDLPHRTSTRRTSA